MSLDLVAVQRDAALLDALAQRTRTDTVGHDPSHAADPVVGLLAALVADVDEGLLDVAGPEAAPLTALIPEQGGHHRRSGTVSTLPLALPPAGRRQVARAVAAAAVVVAAMLSVSGVAAAVSGDPLTPYKRVIDVVRGGYDEVVPKGLFKPTVVAPKAKPANVVAVPRAAGQGRSAVASGASRSSRGTDRGSWNHQGRNDQGWNSNGANRPDRDGRQWGGSGGQDSGTGHHSSRHNRAGHSNGRDSSYNSRDAGGHGDRSGDRRR